jgi:hypothetical protein
MTPTAPEPASPGTAHTGPDGIAQRLAELADHLGVQRDRRLVDELLANAAGLALDAPDTLDLKIATAALREMRDAFRMFAPYRDARKVSIFGSARATADDPLYAQARAAAAEFAARGWMVVTGAGPGIMQAGMEGAGRERSIGVSIRLPFEQRANPIIAGDAKYVSMKYFFTRKLMLIKESKGFVCLPGGFGTLDETFELLTLTQTGKGVPVPIVLLDTPGDPYWEGVDNFVRDQLVSRGLVAESDTELYLVTDRIDDAVAEVCGYYANYDSMRYVGDQLVLRMRVAPTDDQLEQLNEGFAPLCASGQIVRTPPLPIESRENDAVELARVRFHFAKHGFGELRRLIDTLNSFVAGTGGG